MSEYSSHFDSTKQNSLTRKNQDLQVSGSQLNSYLIFEMLTTCPAELCRYCLGLVFWFGVIMIVVSEGISQAHLGAAGIVGTHKLWLPSYSCNSSLCHGRARNKDGVLNLSFYRRMLGGKYCVRQRGSQISLWGAIHRTALTVCPMSLVSGCYTPALTMPLRNLRDSTTKID